MTPHLHYARIVLVTVFLVKPSIVVAHVYQAIVLVMILPLALLLPPASPIVKYMAQMPVET